jgi:hypothetical protein
VAAVLACIVIHSSTIGESVDDGSSTRTLLWMALKMLYRRRKKRMPK